MKKLKDYESQDRRDISDEIDSVSTMLGHDSWIHSNPVYEKSKLESLLGICAGCTNLEYCCTEFGRVYARCSYLEIRLYGQDRMTECTKLSPKGQMSINDMKEIAYYIDVEPESNVGFIKKKKGK